MPFDRLVSKTLAASLYSNSCNNNNNNNNNNNLFSLSLMMFYNCCDIQKDLGVIKYYYKRDGTSRSFMTVHRL